MQSDKEKRSKSRVQQFQDKIYNGSKLNSYGMKLSSEFGVSMTNNAFTDWSWDIDNKITKIVSLIIKYQKK